jgi:uncharacterized protein
LTHFPVGSTVDPILSRRNTLIASNTIKNPDFSNLRLIRFLITIPSLLFVLSIVSQTFAKNYPAYSETTLFLFFLASLLSLLTGLQIHPPVSSFAKPQRREFFSLTDDILFNKEFIKLKGFFHHSDHIYDHVVRVAYISYSISKVLGLNYRAAARGGLLHDFFLYDWRERKATDSSRSLHGKEHPYIALANARKYFVVSDLEADIIVKHMFPKTRPLPRYKESFVVSLSDKIAAVYEYLSKLGHK